MVVLTTLLTLFGAAALPPRSAVLGSMTAVALQYMDHGDNATRSTCGWQHAAFLKGVIAAARSDGVDQRAAAKLAGYARAWGEGQKWVCCNIDKVLTEHDGANDMSCGSTYAEVWMEAPSRPTPKSVYIASIESVLTAVVERPAIDDWWWVDAYFMAMGTFARMGTITHDVRFHNKAFALYNDSAVRRGLWSAASGLYYRDETYFNKTTPHGAHVFWGRGNGWAAGALARVLEFTPATHPAHAVYVAHLRAMAVTLARIQDPADGMWRASLLDPQSVPNPESTGSSGILFGLAYGVNSGVLDKATYLPVVERAWRGMVQHVVDPRSGFLGFCQPVGGGPAPATASDTSDFCVGLFLLAASEVAKLAPQ
jgi:rhamnogalacturonyl hydrolase YesR